MFSCQCPSVPCTGGLSSSRAAVQPLRPAPWAASAGVVAAPLPSQVCVLSSRHSRWRFFECVVISNAVLLEEQELLSLRVGPPYSPLHLPQGLCLGPGRHSVYTAGMAVRFPPQRNKFKGELLLPPPPCVSTQRITVFLRPRSPGGLPPSLPDPSRLALSVLLSPLLPAECKFRSRPHVYVCSGCLQDGVPGFSARRGRHCHLTVSTLPAWLTPC